MKKKLFPKLLLLLAVLLPAACEKDEENISLGGGSTPAAPSGAAAEVAARLEVPALKSGNLLISHWTVENGDSVMTYCLEYDKSKFHSRWVAFRFDGNTRAKTVGRKDYSIKPQYPADPDLPAGYAIEDDASFNGYNHGHLCASADRLYAREANDQTFYMSNMSPQNGSFNQSYWSVLEAFVQAKGRDASFADTLYVCKGGTIAPDSLVLGYTCRNRMPVPKYYFMALLKVKNGNYTSIAFLLEHKNYGFTPSTSDMAKHAVSVDALEERTGIDFFHNLPGNIETATEKLCIPSAWGL